MKYFIKWVSKQYVYMFGYSVSILLLTISIVFFNLIVFFLSSLLFIGMTNKAYKEWKNIYDRYEKIRNKRK